MKRRWIGITMLIAGMAAAPPARAQAPPGPPGPGGPGGEDAREELQETIEIYMIAKMKRFLDLDDSQERKVIPLVEELNASRREMNRRRRIALMKLRPLVEEQREATGRGEAEIVALLEQVEGLDSEFRRTEERMRSEIRSALTPIQQARFLFFQERFRQEMQDRLRRLDDGARPRRGGPPPRERP